MQSIRVAMVPRTRLDKLVTVRERTEDRALENLAHAQSSLGRVAERLAGLRREATSDTRAPGRAELWIVEEVAHVRTLQAVRTVERELAQAVKKEQQARAGYATAHKSAEVARRIQEKKRGEIREEREKWEVRSLDELATQRFNGRQGR